MRVGLDAERSRLSDSMHDLDRRMAVLQAKALANQSPPIDFGMEVSEAFGEFNGLAVERNRAEGALPSGAQFLGHMGDIDGEKPAHSRLLQAFRHQAAP